MSELQSNPVAIPEDRKKMLGILDRFEKQAIDQEQMMDMSEEELLEQIQKQQQHQQPQQHSESAGSTSSGHSGTARRKLTPKERDELIRKAIEEEQMEANTELAEGEHEIDHEDREELERILDQEHQDLIGRFQDVDLDQESFDSIWARLNQEEQREFREKFMIAGRMDDDDIEKGSAGESNSGIVEVDEEEELEAERLLQEMGETLQRGGEKVGKTEDHMMADLDAEDLRAIRDAEISELIPIWRPWWEIEAEEAGQLKKVVVSEVRDKDEAGRLSAASIVAEDSNIDNIQQQDLVSATSSIPVSERVVIDEEAMLRPHQALVQDMEEIKKEEENRRAMAAGVLPMARAPHPSLIYHVCALLFAYAATSRVLNGDLKEEPEQTVAYIFDLCPFFSPPPAAPSSTPSSLKSGATLPVPQVPEVDSFETTLAILQSCSLNSKLWKGDTVRLEMLSLLLRDLTLILARPSRCLKSIRELKDVFTSCIPPSSQGKGVTKRPRLYSKSVLQRLFKKLEFYESYFMSEEWMLKSDRLDRLRTEVVVAGMRVRQEMVGWTRELESVTRVQATVSESKSAEVSGAAEGDTVVSVKKVLIEEQS
ncbi:hypothetical protein BGZ58_000349 [Dissophora ornata]|nr:hypothetical protein BGZ58_000349 [Dissophora ornata]